MKFNEFLQFFSSSRIDRYHNATGKIEIKTIELYKANLTLSKSFHPLLGIFEVLFRNKINEILSNYFNDPILAIITPTKHQDGSGSYCEVAQSEIAPEKFGEKFNIPHYFIISMTFKQKP